MNKRFTKLIAALALLVFMTPSLAGWGQTSSTKTEGFESATTSTTYNSTYTLDANNSDCGVAWTIYYGCVSTNNKISGNNSAQMRWYSSALSNLPYLQTTTAVDGLTNVAFKAKVGNKNVKMDVNYSENGTDWTALATAVTFENANVTVEFSYEIPSGGKYVKIGVSSSSTAPTSGNYALIIDDVVFSYTSSAITTYNLTYKANGGTGEDYLIEDIENGASHTVLGIEAVGFTAPENKTFVNWKDDNDNEYAVGSEITVNGNINLYAQWQLSGSYLFYESFDTNNGTGGNDNQWSGTIASSTLQSDNEDWTFANGSGADRCAKFGTGSKLGSAQTPAIAHTGNATLTFKAAAWNGGSENTTLKLSATSGNLSASTVTLEKGAWTDYTITITGITTSTQIKFEGNAASSSRFFLDEVMVVEAAPSTDPYITSEDVEIAYDATSGSIMAEIGNYVDGSIVASTEAAWITDFTYEQAEEIFEIGFTASQNETVIAREAEVELTFTYGDNQTTTATVTVTQAGNPNMVDNISDITATGTDYAVIGTIVAKSARGLVFGDGTGYVYYYNQNYTQSDYNVGDIKRISGTMGSYNHVYQFTSSAAIEAASSSNYNNTPAVQILDATGIAAYNNNLHLSDYVQIEGTLVKSGNYYNLQVEGLSTDASIAYPTSTQQTELDALENKTVIVKGYFAGVSSNHFNIVLESVEEVVSTDPSITLSYYEINATADATEGTIVATYANIPEGCEVYTALYESDGETTAEYDWITVTINSDNNVAYTIAANTGEARTAYFRVHVADEIGEVNVNSELVTVNQEAYVAPITSGTGTITFGSAEGSTKINSTSVTGDDNLGNTWTITTVFNNDQSFTQSSNYSQVGSSNKPATSITFTMTLPNEAVISSFEAKFGGFNGTAGSVTMSVGSETVGTGALDASNDVTISSLPMVTGKVLTVTVTDIAKGVKCYYISYTLGAETYSLNISAYGESEGGYYLIASPVTVDPATVENMIYAGEDANNYDLYSFDQTQNEEWRNYKVDNFNLVPGKGYLYANKTNGSFSLTGAPYSGDGTIELTYDEAADFAGWNLIGNPYATAATLSQPFYRLTNGSEVSAESETGSVNAMEGVFVVATEAGQTVTFSTENNSKAVEQVVMNLTRNRGTAVDRAIVRFDEGQQLPKFQLNPNNTKLYIAQGNKDYAIVRSAAQGEMPVSFRAAENGTYTLSIETENVEMDYLHLIDNMTGMDVDLLPLCKGGRGDSNNPQTASYTFEAKTSDYTSRFRLVFSANGIDEQNAETFAYFNGSEWMVSNLGEATLQVVDVMGRVLSTETISGNAELSLNQPAGVYMLRLINGNDVKVQKVVVR